MRSSNLFARSLIFYWRTNSAVALGVAAAVTVLAGALIVGDSVRESLRDLVLQRLGRTDLAVLSSGFFRERLADDIRGDSAFATAFQAVCPLILMQGLVSDQSTGRRASHVQLYGVDDRFWEFQGQGGRRGPASHNALLSRALAGALGTTEGATILLRVQRPSSIPIESLHGRKEEVGRTIRLTVQAVLEPGDLGEFSLRPQQGDVRILFVPLQRIQQDLSLPERVNAMIVSATQRAATDRLPLLQTLVRRWARLEDVGLSLRELPAQEMLSLGSDGGLIDDPRARAASEALDGTGMKAWPVLTYLANSLHRDARQVPYSLVTAVDLRAIAPGLDPASLTSNPPPILLNDWTAGDLGAKIGDELTLEYYVWEDPGRLVSKTTLFRVAGIVPIEGAAADRDLAPVYPGITESPNLSDWDPPFPIDLRRVRPTDEDYWHTYRTTPKAFIPLEVGQRLWQSRFGAVTSIRLAPGAGTPLTVARETYSAHLRARIDPLAMGLSAADVRADDLAASRGATDFGEYFTYFSCFLVVSALLLAALFFKLGVEQRAREIGLLRSVGFTTASVRRLFAGEALVLSILGSVLGAFGSVGYGRLMMAGLRTWWVDAVGTTALTLHVSALSLAAGVLGGIVAAAACIWWTLRTLARVSERSLLAGRLAGDDQLVRRSGAVRTLAAAALFGLLGATLLAAALAGLLDRGAAFFIAGTSLLAACLCVITFQLRRPSHRLLQGHGWWPVSRLGWRYAAYRPGRSVLSIAVIASATFVIIAIDAFRRYDGTVSGLHSGTGGYSLIVESLLPIAHDPNSREGRDLLGLSSNDAVTLTPFRLLPGDDASCLNLYEPHNPGILGVRSDFVDAGRFAFQRSLAATEAERADPWRLLQGDSGDGSIPVIADGNSMTYVLHRKLGDEIVINRAARPVRLRLVATLADSIFQSELLMSEANFLKLFPEEQGYRFLLVDAPSGRVGQVAAMLDERLADFGADAMPAAERLAAFHKVENAYLSTFQALGGLGLVLGTVGLATVLLRNVLERRRELALLGAVGYARRQLLTIVIAENLLLLTSGLLVGTLCALLAIAPAAADRGGRIPAGAGGWLLVFAVFVTGLVSSAVATRAAIHAPLLEALRTE